MFISDGTKTREEILGGFDGWCVEGGDCCVLVGAMLLRGRGKTGRRSIKSTHCQRNTIKPLPFPYPPTPTRLTSNTHQNDDDDDSDASIRYHGERADFSVHNASRAKFTVEVRASVVLCWCVCGGGWVTVRSRTGVGMFVGVTGE